MHAYGKPNRVPVFKDDDKVEQPVDPLSLVSATGNIESRLLAHQKSSVGRF